MRRRLRRRMLLLPIATVAIAAPLPFLPPACREPERSAERDFLEGYFPNPVLTTQDGEAVRFYDDCLKDRVVLVNFFFTSCESYCPRATENLARVQARLGDRVGRDVFLYSISVDPERDTPLALRAFAAAHGVKPGWRFLTGRPEDVRAVLASLGFVAGQKSDHTGMVVYGNETRGVWRAMSSVADPDSIVDAVRAIAPDAR